MIKLQRIQNDEQHTVEGCNIPSTLPKKEGTKKMTQSQPGILAKYGIYIILIINLVFSAGAYIEKGQAIKEEVGKLSHSGSSVAQENATSIREHNIRISALEKQSDKNNADHEKIMELLTEISIKLGKLQ